MAIKRAEPRRMFHTSSKLTSRQPPESTSAIRAFYVQVSVPMRLLDAGRVSFGVRVNPLVPNQISLIGESC
jgi:hypothetical protein